MSACLGLDSWGPIEDWTKNMQHNLACVPFFEGNSQSLLLPRRNCRKDGKRKNLANLALRPQWLQPAKHLILQLQ